MSFYVLNAFSLNMIDVASCHVEVKEISLEAASRLWREADSLHWVESGIGHSDTAAVFTNLLGKEVKCNRQTVKLKPRRNFGVGKDAGDVALVGQYSGPRLPEGATALPEGATVRWYTVKVEESFLERLTRDHNRVVERLKEEIEQLKATAPAVPAAEPKKAALGYYGTPLPGEVFRDEGE